MRLRSASMALVSVSLLAVGCTTVTEYSPQEEMLANITEAAPQDSAGNPTVAPPGGTEGTGYVRGIVRASNTPGTGSDTLSTSPRLAGVIVRAYRITGYTRIGPELSQLVGADTTDAQGAFTLPTMPSGNYAVVFIPSILSNYEARWVTAPVHPTSHEWMWWVTLPPVPLR